MRKLLLSGVAASFVFLVVASIAQDESHSIRIQADDQSVGVSSDKLDARKLGVAIYPGAKPEQTNDKSGANLQLDFGSDAMQLVVQKYTTSDSPDRVITFYKKELARYGKVLECRDGKPVGDVPSGLKCESQSDSTEVELQSGTENKRHIVGVSPKDGNTEFGIVYLESQHRGEI